MTNKKIDLGFLFAKACLEVSILFAIIYFAFMIALKDFTNMWFNIFILIAAVFLKTGIEYILYKK